MTKFLSFCMLLAITVLLPFSASAQKKDKDKGKTSKNEQLSDSEAYNRLAAETCDCVTQKASEGKLSGGDLEMQLGLCMLAGVSKYDNFSNINLSNTAEMTQLGERVGILMLGKCPDILMSIFAASAEDFMDEYEEYEDYNWEQQEPIKGALTQVLEVGDAYHLMVKDESGNEHELEWRGYFDGWEALAENPRSAIGRQVTVYWEPVDCYSVKKKEYTTRKEIIAFSFTQ